ncbi:AzlC family ABC transporter permease [Brachyspira catarrhinii]|uniref:Branched-chain amino acid ABC transporter permease n=1 Tax=Brachyspira catarrhinii TaxID=2528966 RepID=A0ABY2TRT7_9SPIR|nr:AzlC family ABC transporter permease [Brachyspira catarrhinii]TKZ35587.1 branched-chain amino acid ABC transporter permease [Brachyspira catarrhinii]
MNRKKEFTKALKYSFPITVPVLIGYLFLSIAYGILMKAKGFETWLAVFMSLAAYCGSMQYIAANYLFLAPFNPIYAFILTLTVNARMSFEGISMVNKYKRTGIFKPFLIFLLTDETFSILYSAKIPENINRKYFLFLVSFLDYSYWIIGTLIGCLLGDIIKFNTKGLDFVLTALFVVIFVEQWIENKDKDKNKGRMAAIIGLICSVPIMIFKTNPFIILAMILIFAVITVIYNIEKHNKNINNKRDKNDE